MYTQVSHALLNVAAFQSGLCSLESIVSQSNMARRLLENNSEIIYFFGSVVSNEKILVCDLEGKNSISLNEVNGDWLVSDYDLKLNLELHNVKEVEKLYTTEIASIIQTLKNTEFDLNSVRLPHLKSIHPITLSTGFNEGGISILEQMQRLSAHIGFILNRNQPVSVGSSLNTQRIITEVLALNNRFQILMTNALIFELTARIKVSN